MSKSPTAMLEEEHRVIERVVAAAAVLAEALEMGKEVEAETPRNLVEFMRTFADKCHHGKEETHLFPVLEKKGVPLSGCPLGALVYEHQRGRALVTELAEAAEAYSTASASAWEPLARALRGIVDLYPGHIWKEDYLLFPMTNKILNLEEREDLRQRFETVEEDIGRDVHHRLTELANRLEESTQGA